MSARNENSFDLESAVALWRGTFAEHESVGADEIRELELHLREDIASWIGKGLTTREAFQIASGRIGAPTEVAEEFAKENPLASWRTRLFWMFVGIIALNVLSTLWGMLT